MSVLCVLVHDDDAEALPTLRLCRKHRDGLRRNIERLATMHGDLETVLAHGNSPQYGGRVTGTSSEPLPINAGVADLRDQIRHDLVWWVLFIADQRGLSGLPDDRVSEIAAWLLTHVDWIAGHKVASVECPPVMAGLAGRGRAMLDPNRKLGTGERCRTTDDDGARCDGTIAMVQKPDETWIANCTVCGTQSAAPYLHDKLAGRWVTIERVQAYALRTHGISAEKATIRSWALRGRVQSQSDGDRTWYDLGSVHRYLTEREKIAG